MSNSLRILAGGIAALAFAAPAMAGGTISGTWNGMNWTASSRVVGQTSTATLAGGGDPLYFASMPQKSGVVALIMEYQDGSAFICSGSLLTSHRVLTAGHCVSGGTEGGGTANLKSVTAYFYGGSNPGGPGNVYNPDLVVPFNAAATAITSNGVAVNPLYTGQVIDQNDIAIVSLSQAAPEWAKTYEIDYSGGLEGKNFTFDGYGARSDTGGAVGDNLGTGRLREGENRYDFRLGDSDFEGVFTDPNFFGPGSDAAKDFSYISDFDNGTLGNDSSCLVAVLGFSLAPSGKYCDAGLGAREASTAGGDSGGPQFSADGKLLSVTSYGLTFGTGFGDVDNALNSSWGELNGFVPLWLHRDFIAAAIPEPQSWAMMLLGFGMLGAGIRVRTRRIAFA